MITVELDIVRETPEAMAGLRQALKERFTCGNTIRDEAYRQALSATVWRLVHFGIETGLASYSARDLCNFSLVAEGYITEVLARIGFSRAIAEGDGELLDIISAQGIASAMAAWHQHLLTADEDAVDATLASMEKDEERHVGRLIVARRFPHRIQPAWLWDIPVEGDDGLPLVAYHLAAAQIHGRPDLRDSTSTYLARHRQVLLVREPDPLLIPLVLTSPATPQTVLAPFAGLYGEPTVVAAAAWHLEHRQPREAWKLAHDMRPLSQHADDAWTIAGLAAVELGHLTEAENLRQQIQDQAGRDRLLLAIAEAQPEAVPDHRIGEAAATCSKENPELFFRLIKELLRRGNISLARDVAQQRHTNIQDEGPLRDILAKILGH